MSENNEKTQECPKCKAVLPIITKDGKTNFFETIIAGEVVRVCWNCKSLEKKPMRSRIGFGQH
jgi:C4-type Zn-finger protein